MSIKRLLKKLKGVNINMKNLTDEQRSIKKLCGIYQQLNERS